MPSRSRRRASAAWEGRPTIRVATLPGTSVYARHLTHPEGVDGVHRTTVNPLGAGSRGAAFEQNWLRANLAGTDVVHVLSLPPGQGAQATTALSRAIAQVRAHGVPLVVTAYHLSDPTGADPLGHHERMGMLLDAADAVITLTDTAAAELRRQWGVEAEVLAHPHAVDFIRMRTPRAPRRSPLRQVGVQLGSLRGPIDPVDLVDALTRAVRDTDGAMLTVALHASVDDPEAQRYAPDAVRRIEQLTAAVGGRVVRHRPLGQSALWDHLAALDVSVVPGLYGSHSIWPEACLDLGTHVVLPAGSHAASQRPAEHGPALTFRAGESVSVMAQDLTEALGSVREQDAAPRSDAQWRWEQRVQGCEAHRQIFERVLQDAPMWELPALPTTAGPREAVLSSVVSRSAQ